MRTAAGSSLRFLLLLPLLRLLRLPLAIGPPLNRDDLCVMGESIDQGDGTRGIRNTVSHCLNGKFVVITIDFCS